jgi:carbon starvation protein
VIACGSLSGFHAIVGSGTTSKMLDNETDALRIGYGGMLTEGFLSTLVICAMGAFGLAVAGVSAGAVGAAGFTPLGIPQFSEAYAMGVNGAFGLSVTFLATFASLVVCAFALTTLDTTNRIGRYAWVDLLTRAVRGDTAKKGLSSSSPTSGWPPP